MVAVSTPVKHAATYADLEALPDDVLGQIVDGELYASPRPATPHTFTASAMGMDVGSLFQRGRGGPGGWWMLFKSELHLGADIVVPDLAGWRHARMPTIPRAAAIELPPDWICEILSPSTALLDRGPKLQRYARAGVPHVWIVDPVEQSLEVFVLRDGAWMLGAVHGTTEKVRVAPFADVELDLAAWWAPEAAPAP